MISVTKKLLQESLKIAKKSHVSSGKIVLDPSVGFLEKTVNGHFFTKIKSDWVKRDLTIIQNLNSIKETILVLISVSNKSFLGEILQKDPSDRLFGSIAAEAISVVNGADIIRTHNVNATKDAITIASNLKNNTKAYNQYSTFLTRFSLEFKEGLTFDDVLLVPKYSDITSRSQTDLTTNYLEISQLTSPL